MGTRLPSFLFLAVFLSFLSNGGYGQQISPRPLITQPVIESELTTLKGNTHPLALPQFDVGAAPPDLPMNRMLLVLKRSPEQEHALRTLLDNQQDKASPQYHKWLTPEAFGAQFGPADQDLQLVTGWLQSHGFAVNRVAHGRGVIEFSGTEGQVEEALHTSIHKYAVNGEEHWANTGDPQIPSALAPVVAGVQALNNFPRRPFSELVGSYSPKTRSLTSAKPQFTFGSGNCYQGECYAVGPADVGKIYNVQPLWSSSVDGTGQTIAIVGESDINLKDVHDFRTLFGLPANDPNIIYDGPNPGPQPDESEADIDVEWSGAIAPNATIDFVVSESTETTAGVDLSAIYIIDHNLAPVMSESYGDCELALGTSGNQFYSTLWAQAAAQGITVILASGDTGANGCTYGPARYGLNVSGFASTPFNVAIGGTDFNDLLNPLAYWSANNTTPTQESANGYIPEITWNLSCTNNFLLGDFGWPSNSENNCNNPQLVNAGLVDSVGGSGGVSNCTTNSQILGSCSGGYTKPSWQVAPGVPSDGRRDIPDVSLFASNGVMNNFYVFCQSDAPYPYSANCAFGQYGAAGGTSFGAPIFAGIMALINQQSNTTQGQGNANYVLYKLASKQTASSCNSATGPATTCIFNDVTSGTIAMPCVAGTPNCKVATAGHNYGILTGYGTATGYDLATGLGSLNVANLVGQWSSVAFRPSVTTLALNPTSSLTHGQAVTVTGSVAASSGTGTPTGSISLLTSTGIAVDGFKLVNGAISDSTNLLPGGAYTVTAHYAGDPIFGGSDSTPVSITVGKESSSTQPRLLTFDWKGNLISNNATTAVYGSPYLFRVNVLNSAGALCSPNPLGESGCPTGTVALTDNGSALDGGAFKLNSLGYTEDQQVQFPGGNNAVTASYAGDNSFNASSASTSLDITPAITTIAMPSVQVSSVGAPFTATVTAQAQSFGAAPTGTVSFFANGVPVTGTVSYQGIAGSASTPTASFNASFTSSASALPNAGTYSITASYSGDANYAGATSSAQSVSVKYPAPDIVTTPNSVSVAPNTPVTLTSIVDTSGKGPLPTSSITYVDNSNGNTLTGTETYTPTTDANGNTALQVNFTFTPTFGMQAQAEFAGDSNYPAAQSSTNVFVTVSGNDFSLATNPQTGLTVSTPGASGSLFIIVSGQSGFNGTINFSPSSCTGLPAEAKCSFNPSSVTGANPPFTGTQLTITTMGPHPFALDRGLEGQSVTWTFASLMFVGAFFLARSPRPNKSLALAAFACVFAFSTVSCGGGAGGGGGGGGGTDPGTPVGSYTITVSGTSGTGSSAITHSTTFTLVVQ